MNQRSGGMASPGALPPGQVDVWYVYQHKVDNPALLEAYRGWLTAEEQAAVNRFRFPHLRLQALVARALQRWVLSKYVQVAPSQWRFAKGSHGKPFVESPRVQAPAFNLSHSGGMIVCAVAGASRVGVDVEDVNRESASTGLAERYFAPVEAADVKRLRGDAMRQQFFRYWTLKEAYIKADGRGLTMPLDSFAFDLQSGCPASMSFADGSDASGWSFGEIAFPGKHHISIAVEPGGHEFRAVAREAIPLVDDAPADQHSQQPIQCSQLNKWFATAGDA